MKKEITGPKYWSLIHKIAINSKNPNHKMMTIRVLLFIMLTFPCEKCNKDIVKILSKYEMENIVKKDLFEWTREIHNTVNKKLNKRELSIGEAMKTHSNELHREDVWNIIHHIASTADQNHRLQFFERVSYLFIILSDQEVVNLIPKNKQCIDNEQLLIWSIFARNETNYPDEKPITLTDIRKSIDGECTDCKLNDTEV